MAEARVERRLAAILAADMAGYSRLMGKDEEGTLAALKAHRKEVIDPTITKHRGRIVKTTGDGALVEFASAVDATRCAIDIQRAMADRNAAIPEDRRVDFRIGINVGDIIIDEGDIYGDGVNVAARLEGLAEPGGVCISGTVFDQVKGKLDLSVDDLGPREVKNIAEPVRSYKVLLLSGTTTPFSSTPTQLDKPSIAVLPFDNMSGDPEQEYFSDGITEDIITALSRIRQFFVIARNTTFTFKNRAVDVQAVARKLGVRYVLEGSVRKAGNRVRITAQLIDGSNGNHLWADRYDKKLEDIFEVQDEITQTVVGAIGPEVDRAERDRAISMPPGNLNAWDHLHRGRWYLDKFETVANAQAQGCFHRAIKLDPSFAQAFASLAEAKFISFFGGLNDTPADNLSQGYDAARTAVALDNKDAVAHSVLGLLHLLRKEHALAIDALQCALNINPSLANAHHWLGLVYSFDGRTDEAIAEQEIATRLSPNDPRLWAFMNVRAYAYVNSGRFEQAAEWANRALRQPNAPRNPYFVLVIALSHLGRAEVLREAADALFKISPGVSISNIRDSIPFKRKEDIELWVDGLRKAGVPE